MSLFRRMMMLKKQNEPPAPIVTIFNNSGISFSATEVTSVRPTGGYFVVKRECKPNTLYTVLFGERPSSISRICYSDENYDGINPITSYGFKNNGQNQEYTFMTNSSARYIYVSVSMDNMTSDAISIIEDTVLQTNDTVTFQTSLNGSVDVIERIANIEVGEKYVVYFNIHYKCLSEQTEGAGVSFRTRSTQMFNYNPKKELHIELGDEGDGVVLGTPTATSNITSRLVSSSSNHISSSRGVVEITVSNYILANYAK